MKKINSILTGAAAVLVALSLAACVSAPKSDAKAAPKADAKATAAKPAESPATLVLNDFEAATAKDFNSWKGGSSAITVEVAADQAHSGKQSVKYTSTNKDYNGFAIVLADDKTDWNAYKTLHFWVFGTNSGKTLTIYLEEAKGEQFYVSGLTDDKAGWKEYVLPFSQFKSRTDYQASTAEVDRTLQLNIKTIQIGPCSGDSSFYLDDFSLTK
jgi:hypothetical protein